MTPTFASKLLQVRHNVAFLQLTFSTAISLPQSAQVLYNIQYFGQTLQKTAHPWAEYPKRSQKTTALSNFVVNSCSFAKNVICTLADKRAMFKS